MPGVQQRHRHAERAVCRHHSVMPDPGQPNFDNLSEMSVTPVFFQDNNRAQFPLRRPLHDARVQRPAERPAAVVDDLRHLDDDADAASGCRRSATSRACRCRSSTATRPSKPLNLPVHGLSRQSGRQRHAARRRASCPPGSGSRRITAAPDPSRWHRGRRRRTATRSWSWSAARARHRGPRPAADQRARPWRSSPTRNDSLVHHPGGRRPHRRRKTIDRG